MPSVEKMRWQTDQKRDSLKERRFRVRHWSEDRTNALSKSYAHIARIVGKFARDGFREVRAPVPERLAELLSKLAEKEQEASSREKHKSEASRRGESREAS